VFETHVIPGSRYEGNKAIAATTMKLDSGFLCTSKQVKLLEGDL